MKKQRGTIVSPDEPRRESGVYWGYSVRIAHSISEIFTKSPYTGGYDLTVGTSDRGTSVQEVPDRSLGFNHLLLVFGGLQGLEEAVANDDKLQIDDPKLLFDHYINVLPKQGSRTIRTEEAILIAMASLREKFEPVIEDVEEELIKEALPRSEDTGGIIPKPSQTKMERKRKRLEEGQQKDEIQAVEHISEEPTLSEKSLKPSPIQGVTIPKEKPKKNPFNKPDKDTSAVVSMDTDIDVDFEIVPACKTETMNAKLFDVHDLSRFD